MIDFRTLTSVQGAMAQQRVTAGILAVFLALSLAALFVPDEVALHFALEPFK